MIRYALKCPEGHRFESWFQSAGAFDALAAAGHVSCPECGAQKVEKCLMAPRVRPARATALPPPAEASESEGKRESNSNADPAHPLAPRGAREAALAELKARIERESDYVGLGFAREARAMHEGTMPERPIYGEARADEAIALIEDGVPVAPLPFTPTRKTN